MSSETLREDMVLGLSVNDLRAELEYRNLSTRGRKSELTLRLLKAVMTAVDDSPVSTPPTPAAGNEVDSGSRIAKLLADSLSTSKLPSPEPPVFSGDPLAYRDWKIAYDSLIDKKPLSSTEKMFYLKQYSSGSAREAIAGFFDFDSVDSYQNCLDLLNSRFGSDYIVTEAMRDKLEQWTPVKQNDHVGLRAFSDYLRACLAAMTAIDDLKILNDTRENRKLQTKLPPRLRDRWAKIAFDTRDETGRFPTFENFVRFVERQSDIANDPMTSFYESETRAPDVKTNLATFTQNESCSFCERSNHHAQRCNQLAKQPYDKQQSFVRDNGLCFACLHKGHLTRDCTNRATCDKCRKPHPTSLHYDRKPNAQSVVEVESAPIPATSYTVVCSVNQNRTSMMSTIVPVLVSHPDNPEREVLTYAMLDTQSDASFVVDSVLRELCAPSQSTELRITTMTSQQALMNTNKVSNLVVRGYGRSRSAQVSLPPVYSRPKIPVSREHIPTRDKARNWKHLRKVANQVPPLLPCEVGLLIGYDCPHAMAPIRYVTGKPGQPFAVETDLGWSVVGEASPPTEPSNASKSIEGILAYESINAENAPSSISLRTQAETREAFAPRDVQIVHSDMIALDHVEFVAHVELSNPSVSVESVAVDAHSVDDLLVAGEPEVGSGIANSMSQVCENWSVRIQFGRFTRWPSPRSGVCWVRGLLPTALTLPLLLLLLFVLVCFLFLSGTGPELLCPDHLAMTKSPLPPAPPPVLEESHLVARTQWQKVPIIVP